MSAQGDDGAGPSVPATAEPGPAPAAAAAAGAPAAPGSADAVRAERVAWAAAMRKLLSPPGAVAPDGSLVQEFFKPKQVTFVAERKWGDAERDKLYEVLATLGVGCWREARARHLPAWDETALRVKASKLLGSQSLARYAGWKGDRGAVDAEFEKNKAIGLRLGCWKAGSLVENDAGDVAAHFAAEAAAGGAGGVGAGGGGGAAAAAAAAAPEAAGGGGAGAAAAAGAEEAGAGAAAGAAGPAKPPGKRRR